ncbi:MAG: adenylate/guanylate cyclase domain-containing protein [Thermodesulfobacteriota bacterium]|jgi:adenylate cyclase
MTTQEVKRKLTAILSADVKGYSRLMGEDEEGTIRTLNTYKEVMSSLIQQQRGRVVDAPGDNVLAEFGSVVDAVRCAVDIQKELKTRNAELPENRKMEFRIGVNLGDVVEDGEQILGDGVNIAARLESLSDAGGICISGTAYDHVENKLSLGYEYLGEQTVKNIAKPVRVYRVLMEPEAAGKVIGEKKAKQRQWQKRALIVLAILIIVAAALVMWRLYLHPAAPPAEVASKEKMAFPLPDKPSIAVLPFVNMSGDPKQEFLCDGMTEEIITALSKVPGLFVIARNSAFTYKEKAVKVKQVSEELGVRYVLEGSVQRSGDRVRVTAQLIDALAGNHLWAEQYDRGLKDIFALQDDITLKVLRGVQAKLTLGAEVLRAQKYAEKYYRGKQGLDCYLRIMEGTEYADRRTLEDNNVARRIAEEVLAMCPGVPMAYLLMAYVHSVDYWLGSTPQESIEKGIDMVQKALALDDTLAEAHSLLGYLYTQKREYDKGIAEAERALALNPSGATVLSNYAMILNFAGRWEDAIPLCEKAIRLDPAGSLLNYLQLGNALMFTGRYEEAISAFKKSLHYGPNYLWTHIQLTATYSMMGREKEARAEAAEVLRINPKFSVDWYLKRSLMKEQSKKDKTANALRKAGLK